MKKPVTWIYKASKQLRSTLSLRWRSLIDRLGHSDHPLTPDDDRQAGKGLRPMNTIGRQQRIPPLFVKFLKPALIVAALIAAYAAIGFYVIPKVVIANLPDIIQKQTNRRASVATIDFNPFKFFLRIHDFKMEEKNAKPFVGFDDLEVKLNALQSVKQLGLVVDEITLAKPVVHLVKQKDGHFNFEALLKPSPKEPKKDEKSKPLPVTISKLLIKDGKVNWEDRHFTKPVTEEITPINLTVSNFSTHPKHNAQVDFNLALKSGGQLVWRAKLGINPVYSEGTLSLDNIHLPKVLALAFSDTAGFDLQGYELFKADYLIETNGNDLKFSLKKANLELRDFQFADKSETKNLLTTPNFSIDTNAQIHLADKNTEVSVKNLTLAGRDMNFSNQGEDALSVNVPSFNHSTELNISQTKDVLKIASDNAAVAIKNLMFTGLREKQAELKIPEINLESAYRLTLSAKETDVAVSRGNFNVRDLLFTKKGESVPLVKIPALDLSDIAVDLKQKAVTIASITSKDADIRTWLNPDGTINYQQFLPADKPKKAAVVRSEYATAKTVDYKESDETTAAASVTPTKPVKGEKEWQLAVNRVEFNNYGIHFEDRTLKKPVKLTAKPINLKVSNVSTHANAALPFQFDMGFNETGSLKLKGSSVIAPLAAKIDMDVTNIALKTFQPYVDKFAKLDVLDGLFNIAGKLSVNQPHGKPLDVTFKGDTGIKHLLTRDQIQNKDFVKWDNLSFKNIDVDLLANHYKSSLLLIEKPYAKVTIRKDKTINFSDIMIADKHESAKTSASEKPKKAKKKNSPSSGTPFFKLDKVKIVDGSSDFADLSLILPFAAQIKSLDGGANGISSEQKSTVKVDLKGNAYDLAPVDIQGEISPYLGNYNIDLNFDGMPMPLVTPYMVEFAGYKIEKGKLTLGLKYQVENGKLQAANNILIDQLELGEKVDNPNAVSLPLELAITLLKDSDGKIRLDVPLTGSLEDPEFDIGHIVVDALVNVLTKIVTSPFSAIASLVGSDADLSTVVFQPGQHALVGAETSKLDNVTKALKEKPALNLEIKGTAFTEQDWKSLREEALLDQLKSAKSAELSQEEGKKIRSEYVELSGDEYNDLLADAFIRRFPTMAEKSLLGTPKLIPPLAGDFYQVAKEKMAELINPDPKRLKDLASERAKEIAKYIVQKGGIPNEKVYILDSVIDPDRTGKEIASLLSLKAN